MNSALIGFLGAILGAGIALLGTMLTNKLGYKNLFAEVVSKNRMDCINNFREELSVFLGTAKLVHDLCLKKCSLCDETKYLDKMECCKPICNGEKAECCKLICDLEKVRVKLLTRLNQDISKEGNEYNKKFAMLISEFKIFNIDDDFIDKYNEIIKVARGILEPEWVKVKKEAKGENQNVG